MKTRQSLKLFHEIRQQKLNWFDYLRFRSIWLQQQRVWSFGKSCMMRWKNLIYLIIFSVLFHMVLFSDKRWGIGGSFTRYDTITVQIQRGYFVYLEMCFRVDVGCVFGRVGREKMWPSRTAGWEDQWGKRSSEHPSIMCGAGEGEGPGRGEDQ